MIRKPIPFRFAWFIVFFTACICSPLVAAAEDAWTYEQSTGKLRLGDKVVAQGYSGHGEGVNNPDKENMRNVGPIPRGDWSIGEPFKHESKGPLVLRLMPVGHKAHGRDGFLIHGDNKDMNKSASEGCIILGAEARKTIAEGGLKRLRVVR